MMRGLLKAEEQACLHAVRGKGQVLPVTHLRMAVITKIASVSEDVEMLEPLCTASGNVKWCSPCGKQSGGFSKG